MDHNIIKDFITKLKKRELNRLKYRKLFNTYKRRFYGPKKNKAIIAFKLKVLKRRRRIRFELRQLTKAICSFYLLMVARCLLFYIRRKTFILLGAFIANRAPRSLYSVFRILFIRLMRWLVDFIAVFTIIGYIYLLINLIVWYFTGDYLL